MATYTLRVSGGASASFSDGQMLTIGRDASCDLTLDDPKVSRFHARIAASDGLVLLDDLQSTNGTMVNGARVSRAALVSGDAISVGDTQIGFAQESDAAQPAQVPQTPPDRTPPPTAQTPRTPTIHTRQSPAAQTVAQIPQAPAAQTPQIPQAPVAQPPQTPASPQAPQPPAVSERQSPRAARREQRAAERRSGVSQTPPRTPPAQPPRRPNVNQPASGGGGRMKWLLAIAALVIAGVVGAAYMGLLPIPLPLPGAEDKPVGKEVARHVHDGTEYVIVDYEGRLAVFSASGASGAAVSSRSVADAVLLSYSWRKALDGFDSDKLADAARTVRDIDDQVSEVREYTEEVVAIFDELDGMGADVPLLGRVSAMDAVREYYAGVGEAESLIRSLDSELGSFGDNADALTRASERVDGVQLASVSGSEMDGLFGDAADAARDLVSTASNLNSKASRARDAAGRLEGALRDASDTPLIGGAIGGFAGSAARLESELSGVQDALGGFESEVAALGRDLRGASESANSARQSDMARWIGEPYDASWPPSDPGRRSAAAALPAAAPAVARVPVPAATATATPVATSTAVPTATAVPAPQINQFEPISAGFYHTCGLREDGAVECWGYDGRGQSSPPGGRFAAVSAGASHTCGLHEDGAVECWGYDGRGQSSPPGGRFVAISAGDAHACGLREDGAVECWGYNEDGQASPPGGRFVSVSAGHTHSCGIREDGTVDCWGGHAYYYGFPTLPDGRFTAISALNHTCGIREDGAVECWGYNEDGQASPPGGRFAAVSAGLYHTCGLREDGTAECWGEDTYADETSPPGGRFAAVSTGSFHTCGLREDGAVECWGYDGRGQSSPPGGRFAVP